MATSWEYRYAQRTKGMKSSIVREILKVTSQPDVISFAGGMPAPELFPAQRSRGSVHQGAPRARRQCAAIQHQ